MFECTVYLLGFLGTGEVTFIAPHWMNFWIIPWGLLFTIIITYNSQRNVGADGYGIKRIVDDG